MLEVMRRPKLVADTLDEARSRISPLSLRYPDCPVLVAPLAAEGHALAELACRSPRLDSTAATSGQSLELRPPPSARC